METKTSESEERDLSQLEEYAICLVASLIDKRQKENKAPFMAYLDEMLEQAQEDIKDVMRKYVRDKTLICHKNVNDRIMFEFTPPK